jgi:hypothetical protein
VGGELTALICICAQGVGGHAGAKRECRRVADQELWGARNRRSATLSGADDGSRSLEGFTGTMTASEEQCQLVTGSLVDRRALLDRLAGASRVTQITAPPGSGKTVRIAFAT